MEMIEFCVRKRGMSRRAGDGPSAGIFVEPRFEFV